MAALQLEEDQVTCSICLCRYWNPVTLPCGHSFCGTCIQDSWRSSEKLCPVCRQPFPAGTKLCRNVTLSNLLKALPPELPAPATAIPRQETGAGHSARCPRHGRSLEFFCRTEGLCVCSACTVHECRHHERALLDVERRMHEVRDGAFRKAGLFVARDWGCSRRLPVPRGNQRACAPECDTQPSRVLGQGWQPHLLLWSAFSKCTNTLHSMEGGRV